MRFLFLTTRNWASGELFALGGDKVEAGVRVGAMLAAIRGFVAEKTEATTVDWLKEKIRSMSGWIEMAIWKGLFGWRMTIESRCRRTQEGLFGLSPLLQDSVQKGWMSLRSQRRCLGFVAGHPCLSDDQQEIYHQQHHHNKSSPGPGSPS
jgi:hypothetical protein